MEVRLIEQFESAPFTRFVTGSRTDCSVHFPWLPRCMEGFKFFPASVEIKPKISGGD